MPDMPRLTATIGVRVGTGVGSDDGAGVGGVVVGAGVGAGLVGVGVGTLVGSDVGATANEMKMFEKSASLYVFVSQSFTKPIAPTGVS